MLSLRQPGRARVSAGRVAEPVERTLTGEPRRPGISTPVFLALAAYLIVVMCIWGNLGLSRLLAEWHWLNDLHFFRDAARLLYGGQQAILYDPEARANRLFDIGVSHETFPYPATMALLFLPIQSLGLETGRYIFLALSLAASLGSVLVAYRWSGDWRLAVLMALAMASSFTFYETLRFSQLAPFIGLCSVLALVNLARGKHNNAGIYVGLLALKPSVALAPMLVLMLLPRWRSALVAALVGLTVGLLIPLLIVGPEGQLDYLRLVERYGDVAYHLDGKFTAGAAWMLNWHGLVGRLLGEDPPKLPVILLGLVTVMLVVRVWLRRELFSSWLAGALGTLLLVPHAVFYDWVMLYSIAPVVAYALRSRTLVMLLLLLHLSVSLDSHEIMSLNNLSNSHIFLTPLVAVALLVSLAPVSIPVTRPPARYFSSMLGWSTRQNFSRH